MTTSYEYYSAQVAHASEAELDQANFEADMARQPVPFYSEAELEEMEAEHFAWLETRQVRV
jgi:hypothetical protein